MQLVWCWRCQRIVPMLDPTEAAAMGRVLRRIHVGPLASIRQRIIAWRHGDKLTAQRERAVYAPAFRLYRRYTGVEAADYRTLIDHSLRPRGPACESCGRPLRTRAARMCAACGRPRSASRPAV